jgi:hypothetical protein
MSALVAGHAGKGDQTARCGHQSYRARDEVASRDAPLFPDPRRSGGADCIGTPGQLCDAVARAGAPQETRVWPRCSQIGWGAGEIAGLPSAAVQFWLMSPGKAHQPATPGLVVVDDSTGRSQPPARPRIPALPSARLHRPPTSEEDGGLSRVTSAGVAAPAPAHPFPAVFGDQRPVPAQPAPRSAPQPRARMPRSCSGGCLSRGSVTCTTTTPPPSLGDKRAADTSRQPGPGDRRYNAKDWRL